MGGVSIVSVYDVVSAAEKRMGKRIIQRVKRNGKRRRFGPVETGFGAIAG